MKTLNLTIMLFLILTAGCSTVKVVPEQVPFGIINLKDNSQVIKKDNISIAISPADMDMVNYNIESIVASFNVDIQNNSDGETSFDKDSFALIDSNSRQYYPLTTEKIKEMMTRDTFYLLPYPYIGFYYLEDYEQAQFKNSSSSNLPYYFELRPQNLSTMALPFEPIIPKAGIKGLLYFHTDIRSISSFSINIYKKGASKSLPPDFIFPFKVMK
ncbi:MAG: hypothetical protein HXX17_01330 [Geobacteraceae bacterium]|nr:hypothetical protein [Geobacteraceae bacterium]